MSKYENRPHENRSDYEYRRKEEQRRRYQQEIYPEAERRQQKKQKKRRKGSPVGSFFTVLLLLIAIGVFCYAAYKLNGYYMDYKAGSDEYTKLNDQFTSIEPAAPSGSATSAGQKTETEQQTEIPSDGVLRDISDLEDPATVAGKVDKASKEEVEENGTRKILPMLRNPINFSELNAINPDIIGWIRIGALDISYPIAQGQDNEYYLHRTFERQDNFAGCIFLNCDNSKYFTDQNSIVYGHNMKNGSMFGTLKDMRNQDVYDSNPYFWIFTPTLIYQYRIFNCAVVSTVGDPYRTRFTTEEFQQFINTMQEGTMVDNHQTLVTTDDRICTLSTCTGNQETRFICQGVLQQIYSAK